MGNTLSKLLIGSVISISLTSNGINAKQNEFDRASFEKAWKEFLRQQAIERGLDVSKYRYRSSSRSILSDQQTEFTGFAKEVESHEINRDKTVGNDEGISAVANAYFENGKSLFKMNKEIFGGPIFYGMATRLFIPALQGFREADNKMGYCHVSEYFTLLLFDMHTSELKKIMHKDKKNKDGSNGWDSEVQQQEAKEYSNQILSDAKLCATLYFYFRKETTPGQLEPDMYEALTGMEFVDYDEYTEYLNEERDHIEIVNDVTEWKGGDTSKALMELEKLLEKYKSLGVDEDAEMNYLDVLENLDVIRDEHLKDKNILGLNYDDLLMGRAYFELSGMLDGFDGSEYIGKHMLKMLGAMKYLKVLKFKDRLNEILNVKNIEESNAEAEGLSVLLNAMKRSLENEGSEPLDGITAPAKAIEALEKRLKCQSDCLEKKVNELKNGHSCDCEED